MKLRATWILVGAALLGACTSPGGTQNTYKGGDDLESMTSIEKNRYLKDSLSILDVRTRELDGRKQVQFELQNKTNRNLPFAWAVLWFDANGFQVSDGTRAWEPIVLGGHGKKLLLITAPSASAKTWQLEVTTPNEIN
jgi:uncharacterized protein YcfL